MSCVYQEERNILITRDGEKLVQTNPIKLTLILLITPLQLITLAQAPLPCRILTIYSTLIVQLNV